MTGRWKNSLVLKVFLSYYGIVLLLFVFFYFYSGAVVRDFYISSLAEKMQREAALAARLIPSSLEGDALDGICRQLAVDLNARITVIDPEGKVLGDSDERSATMENHAGRPEVVEALSRGLGKITRYSATVSKELLYQAIVQEDTAGKRVIRLSIPLSHVQEAMASLRKAILWGLAFASVFGLVSAFAFSRHLSRRIGYITDFSRKVAAGSFPGDSLPAKGDDELSLLERNLNEMNRRIEEKIGEIVSEKEKAESILRCMIEGVLVVDSQGRLILVNDHAREMFKLPPGRDLRGASLLELSRHPQMKQLMKEVLTCHPAMEYLAKEICLDDGKWFRVNTTSLRGEHEKPLGYILVFHDVTELKRLETVRADFVANVSHELRTPLTAIRGYAETLLQSPPADPKDTSQFLSIIYRHSERLGRLIDDLLALSDLESGKIQIVREKLQSTELIGRVSEIFQDQARRKDIAITQTIGTNLPAILGDSDRLQQLLINLVDNALKYTPAGGRVEVRASLAALEDNHAPMVEISVADTGCGITQKDIPRLTERFYRVDKARSREMGGTGLGLAIVKHIVQAHGGLLTIESQIQKGTTVRVCLPAENGKRI